MKYFVIDSLSRSGTTLLSALLRTQEKLVTFDGGFREPMCTDRGLSWPHGYAISDIVESNAVRMRPFRTYKEQVCERLKNKRLFYTCMPVAINCVLKKAYLNSIFYIIF